MWLVQGMVWPKQKTMEAGKKAANAACKWNKISWKRPQIMKIFRFVCWFISIPKIKTRLFFFLDKICTRNRLHKNKHLIQSIDFGYYVCTRIVNRLLLRFISFPKLGLNFCFGNYQKLRWKPLKAHQIDRRK